jgi:hypothetical protein
MVRESVEMQSIAEHSVFRIRAESETLSEIGYPEKLCPAGAGRAPRQQGGAAQGKAQHPLFTMLPLTATARHTKGLQ